MLDDVDNEIEGLADLELIGDPGGFGEVYRARETANDRDVAVKFLTQIGGSARAAFDRERKILGRLSSHPGIVTLLSSGFSDVSGVPYLVMELHDSGSLRQRIQQAGPFEADRAIELAIALARALSHGHRQGVIHRDIKPANVLLADHGPVLADFGISGGGGTQWKMPYSKNYAPPELYTAKRSAEGEATDPRDARSDLYSLAATLFYMVVGESPITSIADQLQGKCHRSTGRSDLDDFLGRAMSVDPAERYQSAEEFIQGLDALGGRSADEVEAQNGSQFTAEATKKRSYPLGAEGVPAWATGTDRGRTHRQPLALVGTLAGISVMVAAAVFFLWPVNPSSPNGTTVAVATSDDEIAQGAVPPTSDQVAVGEAIAAPVAPINESSNSVEPPFVSEPITEIPQVEGAIPTISELPLPNSTAEPAPTAPEVAESAATVKPVLTATEVPVPTGTSAMAVTASSGESSNAAGRLEANLPGGLSIVLPGWDLVALCSQSGFHTHLVDVLVYRPEDREGRFAVNGLWSRLTIGAELHDGRILSQSVKGDWTPGTPIVAELYDSVGVVASKSTVIPDCG